MRTNTARRVPTGHTPNEEILEHEVPKPKEHPQSFSRSALHRRRAAFVLEAGEAPGGTVVELLRGSTFSGTPTREVRVTLSAQNSHADRALAYRIAAAAEELSQDRRWTIGVDAGDGRIWIEDQHHDPIALREHAATLFAAMVQAGVR